MSVVQLQAKTLSRSRIYSRNVLVSGLRLVVLVASGFVLPAYLSHHLAPTRYGAWILVIQVAGYVSYLEFGVTTAISKFVAEHVSSGDQKACDQHASAGVAITWATGIFGILASVLLAALVPYLFHDMSPALSGDVSRGVLLVGTSLAILLAGASFAGIFMGLQRFAVPMTLITVNKLLYVLVVLVAVSREATLTQMGAAVAVVNVLTALAVVVCWKCMIPQIRVQRQFVNGPIVKKMLSYCAVLGVWNSGMLLISGLDTTIVGHFDFAAIAFYAIAATPSSFLTTGLHALFGPLMPAVSAASVEKTPHEMGLLLEKSSRYSFLLAQLFGLPILMFGYWVLLIWVGRSYAVYGLLFLRILIAATILRNFFGPFATMVIATGLQRYATLSGVLEATTNLVFSILLGAKYGAKGVAFGTLIGACVGVGVHFFISLKNTRGTFATSPYRVFVYGMLRPSVVALPTLLLLPFPWRAGGVSNNLVIIVAWSFSSLFLGWKVGLLPLERNRIVNTLRDSIRSTILLRVDKVGARQ